MTNKLKPNFGSQMMSFQHKLYWTWYMVCDSKVWHGWSKAWKPSEIHFIAGSDRMWQRAIHNDTMKSDKVTWGCHMRRFDLETVTSPIQGRIKALVGPIHFLIFADQNFFWESLPFILTFVGPFLINFSLCRPCSINFCLHKPLHLRRP